MLSRNTSSLRAAIFYISAPTRYHLKTHTPQNVRGTVDINTKPPAPARSALVITSNQTGSRCLVSRTQYTHLASRTCLPTPWIRTRSTHPPAVSKTAPQSHLSMCSINWTHHPCRIQGEGKGVINTLATANILCTIQPRKVISSYLTHRSHLPIPGPTDPSFFATPWTSKSCSYEQVDPPPTRRWGAQLDPARRCGCGPC